MRDLRDVQEAVDARQHLDEGPEVGDALHRAQVRLVELRGRGELLDDRERALGRLVVVRRHVDGAVVLDVDAHPGALDDAADGLAAGPDDVADLVDGNLDGDDAGGEGRDVRAGVGEGGAHALEDVQPARPGLLERFPHDGGGDAADLDVHLQGGDARRGARDLEVHVAVVVLGPGDVAEHGVAPRGLVDDQAHGHPGHRCREGDAGVHHGQRAAAHRGHRRRPVRLQDVGDHPYRVGERLFAGQHRQQAALGEVAVADLAPARAPEELDLAHRERREVVVQHETAVHLAVDQLDLLLVVGGAEGRGDQGLRLAAGEHGRAVGPRQHADVGGDGPDLVELAAVQPLAAFEDLVPQHPLLQALEDGLDVAAALRVVVRQGRQVVVEHAVDGGVVLELVADAHGLRQGAEQRALRLADQLRRRRLRFDVQLRLAGCLGQLVDLVDDAADGLVAGVERVDHLRFRKLLRPGLDHDEGVPAARHHEVQPAPPALVVGRVDDDPAVEHAHPDRRDGRRHRYLGGGEGGRGPGQGQDVRVVVGVGGDDEGHDLRLAVPAGGEERPDRPVDQPARQHLLLRRLALALEEPAGDAPRGVGVLPVVDGQREEVDPLALAGRVARGDEDHGVAVPDHHRAVRLPGQPAGLEGQGTTADIHFA